MGFQKPFRAAPIKLGPRYRARQRSDFRKQAFRYLTVAGALGVIIGAGSAQMIDALKPMAVQAGIVRARRPEVGDYWSGCSAARAAGTAPIYLGEPGFRAEMDGDGDGIACEPYRGR
jgi:hypothetical protein